MEIQARAIPPLLKGNYVLGAAGTANPPITNEVIKDPATTNGYQISNQLDLDEANCSLFCHPDKEEQHAVNVQDDSSDDEDDVEFVLPSGEVYENDEQETEEHVVIGMW
ncbi:hypothetical protein L1987_00849 [Smallanthus sonchifolius]|uniref:Uncharacterized protein n=1 Tax=Smallanthus sonchifolius TaxID=185202 RepID=A0ACB9K3H5_9ASTR|nr:hypothetical protein L1987_00849 [Smallanthus sonchifolius]